MKLLLTTLGVVFTLAAATTEEHEHPQLRARYLTTNDELPGDFTIENNSLFSCMTVIEEAPGQYRVGFRPCDRSTQPSLQMWRFQDDGKIRSRAEEGLCLAVGANNLLGLTNCNTATGDLTRFSFEFDEYNDNGEREYYGEIEVGTRCLREGGTDTEPYENEIIIADECDISDRFQWHLKTVSYFGVFHANGCIVPQCFANGIMFATCDFRSSSIITHWWQDDRGLIHSRLAPDMCMQAAHSTVLVDGSKMRFYPCDKDNSHQRFETVCCSGYIKLESRPELCVVPQGSPPTEDVSAIIFKDCGAIGPRAHPWTARSEPSED